MKDGNDSSTGDIFGKRNQPVPFNSRGAVYDRQSSVAAEPPEVAKAGQTSEAMNRCTKFYFVPVSFVAKDWQVSPRRVRFLLTAGRLQGRLKSNGFWEVMYPYAFVFGTRGPSLKRQKKPERRAVCKI